MRDLFLPPPPQKALTVRYGSNNYQIEEEARKFWRQMVQGVQYMHDCHVVHRDLKVNIMSHFGGGGGGERRSK